jgi:hypothetical protein
MQDIQDKETSTNEVQTEYKREYKKKIPPGGKGVCVISKDKRQNAGQSRLRNKLG